MDLIITGRVFNKNNLVGYRLWKIEKGKFTPFYVGKVDVCNIFKKYNVLNCKLTTQNSITSSIRVPIIHYPKYNIEGRLLKNSRFTDSEIIAITYDCPVDVIRINVCGALIYGAITSINSNEAEAHAELYYEEIRKMSTDIIKIAKRTGYSIEEIRKVKNYLFMEQHALFNGYKRFDPSFEIAQTWQRLMSENMIIEPHDIVLIEHELYEMSLISEGLSQDDAHLIATKSYDYAKESREYYVKIRKHNKRG